MTESCDSWSTVAQARRELAESDWSPSDRVLQTLLDDSRAGIRALGARVLSLRRKRAAEQERCRRMLVLEKDLWARGLTAVAGIDEAGRGPLAGPVVAAAVILRPDADPPEADDSKRLSARRREELFGPIFRSARAVGIGVVPHEVIDRRNIRRATFLAMRTALARLGLSPDYVLVDGDRIPDLDRPQRGIPQGDQKSLSVAAASVVAKVVRDRIMAVLDRRFPGYGFGRHKGYGTPAHRAAIDRLGLCPIHRRTFCRP